jgi:hypothetical protein
MVTVPAEAPVMTPVAGLTVAIAGLFDVQLPPADVDENVEFSPIQIAWVPLSVPATGGAVTVTVRVAT